MIHNFKTEGFSQEDFRGYQNLLKLFENLRNSDANPKKVLKSLNQT